MIEIRVHGRGGQGGKKAAQIIARTAFLNGYKTQDFALYGAERKNAPVVSFCRLDRKKINTRGYVFEPDYILIIDDSIDMETMLKGRKKNTVTIMNTKKKIKGIYCVDATEMAIKEIGKPIGANVALAGGLLRFMKMLKLKDFEKAVAIELEKYGKDIVRKNIKAAKRCYDEIS